MDWFGPRCKDSRNRRGDLGADDAFSAHLRGPLTGETVGWKLRAFL